MRLVSWIGGNDLDAAEGKIEQSGAISATLASASFTELHLLYSYPEKWVTNYLPWLSSQYDRPVAKRRAALTSSVDFLPCGRCFVRWFYSGKHRAYCRFAKLKHFYHERE